MEGVLRKPPNSDDVPWLTAVAGMNGSSESDTFGEMKGYL